MSEPRITFEGVWKKFDRAQRFDSLRDLIPAMSSALFQRRRRDDTLHGKEFWALRDVSFEVRPGEALGIIGPNGAGKSTVLKVLTKILRADRGRSVVRGKVGALVEIAAGFHPDLTGRENVFLQGAIMGMRRADITARFDEIVDFAGVSEFIDTQVKRYSSGMNARLGFSVAAHLDPDVLLIDEVLSVGDLSFQEKCYERMHQFVRSGIAVVFVSHNLSAISFLCDRVLVLRRGRVETMGPTHEAITTYARLVADAKSAEGGHDEVFFELLGHDGGPVTEVNAGGRVVAHATALVGSARQTVHAELQIRHLESGVRIYRCSNTASGSEPLMAEPRGTIEFGWSLDANLGRGHYALSCLVLNERNEVVGRSSPLLLTVHERQSDQSVVFLNVESTARLLADGSGRQSGRSPAANREAADPE